MSLLFTIVSDQLEDRMTHPPPTFFMHPLTDTERRLINARSPNLFSWLTSFQRQVTEDCPTSMSSPQWDSFYRFVLLLAHCLQPEHDVYFRELTRCADRQETTYDQLYRQIERLGLNRSEVLIQRVDLIRQITRHPNPIREQAATLWGEATPSFDEQLLELEHLSSALKDVEKLLYAIVLCIVGSNTHRRHLLVHGHACPLPPK